MRMIEIIERSMENTSLKLNDKTTACRFPPVIFQIAHSGSAYKELNSLMPIFPGLRTLQGFKQKTRVRDGRNPVPYYQQRLSMAVAACCWNK